MNLFELIFFTSHVFSNIVSDLIRTVMAAPIELEGIKRIVIRIVMQAEYRNTYRLQKMCIVTPLLHMYMYE